MALTYDGDAAGRDAMMRSLGVLLAEGLDVSVVDLPAGEDPDTLVKRGGADAWRVLRDASTDPVEFIQRHVLRAGGSGDPRERALQAVVALGAVVADPIRLRLLAERAERVLGVAPAVLERAIAIKRRPQPGDAPAGVAYEGARADRIGSRAPAAARIAGGSRRTRGSAAAAEPRGFPRSDMRGARARAVERRQRSAGGRRARGAGA